MRICISSRYCSFKEDLNNRCIWYTLQRDHHRQKNLWEQRSLNVEPTPHWKLSSFQIRNPKPLIHINDIYIYTVQNKYIIYMFFYHIISSANWKLSSFEIKKGGDAKSNKERSVFSPGAGRLPENEGEIIFLACFRKSSPSLIGHSGARWRLSEF